MPDYAWTCDCCTTKNPAYTEVCRDCGGEYQKTAHGITARAQREQEKPQRHPLPAKPESAPLPPDYVYHAALCERVPQVTQPVTQPSVEVGWSEVIFQGLTLLAIALVIGVAIIALAFVAAPFSCLGGIAAYLMLGIAACIGAIATAFRMHANRPVFVRFAWSIGLIALWGGAWVAGVALAGFQIMCF